MANTAAPAASLKKWTDQVPQEQPLEVDLDKHPSGIVPTLQNVVATCYLGRKLDLKHIAMHARNAEYNPKRFAAVIMRIREPKTTALVFSSGKMVCTGAKSEGDVRLASRKFARIIQKLGFEDAKFKDFKVQNIVGSCDAKFPIRLEGLHFKHSLFSSYEPELFPGLIYRMKQPKVVLLIFVSGKVVLTGAKTRDEIYKAFETIHPALVEFRKGDPAAAPGMEALPSKKRSLSQKEDTSEMLSFHSIMSNVNSLRTVETMSNSYLARSLGGAMSYGDPDRKRTRVDSVTMHGAPSLETIPSSNWNVPLSSTPRIARPPSP